jgi:hypothetical protein
MLVVALSLSEQVEKIGAYAGIAAFFGFAILAILCFAQAREIKRLRDWAGRAPERAAELEARVMADAAVRSRAPVRAATAAAAGPPAAVAPAPTPAPAQANGEAPAAAPVASPEAPAAEEGKAEEVPTPAEAAVEGEAEKPAEAADEAKEEVAPVAEGEAEAEKPDAEKAPAAAAAAAPVAAATAAASAPPSATPGNGTPGEIPPLPRATPAPRPGPAAQPPRPRPGAAPLRTGNNPAVRRPVPPSPAARRVGPPAEPEGRSPGRLAALVAGGVIGLIALVFAATQIFGGEEETPAPNKPSTEAEVTATPDATREPTNTAPSPAETTVAVLNGTFTGGLAAETADKIVGAGFKKGTVGDYSDQARAVSVVLYAKNSRKRALEVAKLLEIPSTSVEPVNESENPAEGSDVVVIVGADQTQ